MEIKTFRAKTMPQALALVRSELGPEAMVLHTRELHAGLLGRMFLGRQYEIAATPGAATQLSIDTPTPSPRRGGSTEHDRQWRSSAGATAREAMGRGEALPDDPDNSVEFIPTNRTSPIPHSPFPIPPSPSGFDLELAEFQTLVEQLRTRTSSTKHSMPPALFDVFTDLIEADVDEPQARELIDRLRTEEHLDLTDPLAARARLAQLLEAELRVSGPIDIQPGAGRVVALVGPTGVGKTTTIAKLAANFRLRENRRVGLITVDTYRIAAVEQLRTYADIIDLPMEVVSTPREMREAVQRMRTFDLVLMDTAGRSPRDEVKIQELRAMLAEATPDEVHLVLSAASGARALGAAAEKFAAVGVTSMLITKLDEATGLGNLLSLARTCELPFSYLTDGQNVPDDIAVAQSKRLAQLVLNIQGGPWAVGSGQ
jgi:flagellar biosynthesis protein FlhF